YLLDGSIARSSKGSRYRSFFFQAEDGIRDFHVTGVQTCALPISACVVLECRVVEALSLGRHSHLTLHESVMKPGYRRDDGDPAWRGRCLRAALNGWYVPLTTGDENDKAKTGLRANLDEPN